MSQIPSRLHLFVDSFLDVSFSYRLIHLASSTDQILIHQTSRQLYLFETTAEHLLQFWKRIVIFRSNQTTFEKEWNLQSMSLDNKKYLKENSISSLFQKRVQYNSSKKKSSNQNSSTKKIKHNHQSSNSSSPVTYDSNYMFWILILLFGTGGFLLYRMIIHPQVFDSDTREKVRTESIQQRNSNIKNSNEQEQLSTSEQSNKKVFQRNSKVTPSLQKSTVNNTSKPNFQTQDVSAHLRWIQKRVCTEILRNSNIITQQCKLKWREEDPFQVTVMLDSNYKCTSFSFLPKPISDRKLRKCNRQFKSNFDLLGNVVSEEDIKLLFTGKVYSVECFYR